MNISLPASLQLWVDEQVAKNRSRSPSQYISKVLRKEKQRQLISDVERKLIEGLNSGQAREFTDADWEQLRQKARRRVAARKAGK
jgi:antitoxin ParD1/3/4